MTEQEWHEKNNDAITRAMWRGDWTAIRKLFKECWHDGFKVGFKSPNKPAKSPRQGETEAKH